MPERSTHPRARTQVLGVVIPLANEEATVTQLLQRVSAQLLPQDKIFCVLDAVSHDTTRQLVQEAAAEAAGITLVWEPENTCVAGAYLAGFREALNAGCNWILEMDGGLSHLPEQIPRFLKAMEAGAEFAAGSRFCNGGVYEGSFWRKMLSRGGTRLTNRLLGTDMHDMTSGFECFRREVLAPLCKGPLLSRGHMFQTEIRVLLQEAKWVEVPISYAHPSASIRGKTVWEALRILSVLRRRKHPLQRRVPSALKNAGGQ